MNFTDSEFKNAEKYKISNGLAGQGTLSTYKNNVNVNSASVNLFTGDGWEFRRSRS